MLYNSGVMLYQVLGSDLPFIEILALMLGYMLALIFSFSLHEFSHAFVSTKLGDPTPRQMGRLTLNPLKHIDPVGFLCLVLFGFGWAKPVSVNPVYYKHYKSGMSMVSLAGVTMNLILAFVFSGIWYFCGASVSASSNMFMVFLTFFLYFMLSINLSLFVFNLLPIYPLDGYNFLKAILPPNNKFISFLERYGTIILLIFLITPLFDYIYNFVVGNLIKLFSGFWGLF